MKLFMAFFLLGISAVASGLPSVSFLQKPSSSRVTCHATGFYPDKANLTWTKDGEELHENVVRGEILPNHDGTFQMSVDLDLKEVKEEDWWRYSCVFQHSGAQDDVIVLLEKRKIKTDGFPTAAVVIGVIFLASCILGLLLIFCRRKRHRYRPTSHYACAGCVGGGDADTDFDGVVDDGCGFDCFGDGDCDCDCGCDSFFS